MENERKATIHDYARLCSSHSDGCFNCPISYYHNGERRTCGTFVVKYPDKANEIIIKWCDEHPVKTYADDFFEKFPNAERKYDYEIPNVCINRIYPNAECDCYNKICSECWRTPYKEYE